MAGRRAVSSNGGTRCSRIGNWGADRAARGPERGSPGRTARSGSLGPSDGEDYEVVAVPRLDVDRRVEPVEHVVGAHEEHQLHELPLAEVALQLIEELVGNGVGAGDVQLGEEQRQLLAFGKV